MRRARAAAWGEQRAGERASERVRISVCSKCSTLQRVSQSVSVSMGEAGSAVDGLSGGLMTRRRRAGAGAGGDAAVGRKGERILQQGGSSRVQDCRRVASRRGLWEFSPSRACEFTQPATSLGPLLNGYSLVTRVSLV